MKVAIIGAGNMGGAIARGLAHGHQVNTEDIFVSNPGTEKLERPKAEYPGIHTTQSNKEAAADADIVIIAVKPWKVEEVLKPLRLRQPQILVSVAAGLTFEDLAHFVDPEMTIFRIIPNTAISERASMTLVAARNASEAQVSSIMNLFNEMGRSMLIEEKIICSGHLTDFLRHCLCIEICTGSHAGWSGNGYQASGCHEDAGSDSRRSRPAAAFQRTDASGTGN